MARNKRPELRPRRATRRHKARVFVERAILGVMMSAVAWVVERRRLKVLKSGSSSRKALQKAERDEQRRSRNPVKREAGVAAGSDDPQSS